jgi:hypothetical protein
MIVGDNGSFSDRVMSFASLSEVADEFATTDAEYLAANAIFAQNPKVDVIKIGKLTSKVAQQITLTFSANLVTGNTVNGKINGVSITPVPFNTTHDQTMTDLAGVINALSAVDAVVTGGAGSKVITITSHTAGLAFTATEFVVTGGASQATCAIATTVDNHGIAEDLDEIQEEDNSWYGLIYCERTQDFVEDCAAWVEANYKLFITCSSDADILDDTVTTDIASVLSLANYMRTAVIYNAKPDDYADAAWMGNVFVYESGEATWKFKTLTGITKDDPTSSELANAEEKNCNMYVSTATNSMTEQGVVANGAFIDDVQCYDWLMVSIQESCFAPLIAKPKVPFTDAGIGIIVTALEKVLKNAETSTIPKITNDPKYTITYPKASEVSAADRAARTLTGISFTATTSGGIHAIQINGTLSF